MLVAEKIEAVRHVLSEDNIREYRVPWKPGGIAESEKDHKQYLDTFCDDFISGVERLITEQTQAAASEKTKENSYQIKVTPVIHKITEEDIRPKKGAGAPGMKDGMNFNMFSGMMTLKNLIYEHEAAEDGSSNFVGSGDIDRQKLHAEILHHAVICRIRCGVFCGRELELGKIKKYILEEGTGKPLVVYSPSGGGKTSLMAMAAHMTKLWTPGPSTTIVRFLGTSPSSSTLKRMLISLCEQICVAYGETLNRNELTCLSSSKKYFSNLLLYISGKYGPNRPLYIVLDSIDQLVSTGGAHTLKWLPCICPAHVKIIISFIPAIGNCLENARQYLKCKDCFITLEVPTKETYRQICESTLRSKHRLLTEEQLKYVCDAISSVDCSSLLLSMWANQMETWSSQTPVSKLCLHKSVEEAVTHLFGKLEAKYGEMFVSASLGYVTICKDGITTAELEDALSCDDIVLSDVYRHHDPPVEGIIRIPSLLWARVRYDLKDYLVDRLSNERTTLAWYHRQVVEAATKRYLVGPKAIQLHKALAELFLADEGITRTIHLAHRQKTIENADRQVAPQPMVPSNTRKLTASFYHLFHSGHLTEIEDTLLSSLKYIICLASSLAIPKYAREVNDILDYLTEGAGHCIKQAIVQTQSTVINDPTALPVYLRGKLLLHQNSSSFVQKLCPQIEEFLEKCMKGSLMPLTPVMSSTKNGLRWSVYGISETFGHTQNDMKLAVSYGAQSKHLCKIFHTGKAIVVFSLKRTKSVSDARIVCAKFSNQISNRLFILCKSHLLIWNYMENTVQYETNNINKKGPLNSYLMISDDDR